MTKQTRKPKYIKEEEFLSQFLDFNKQIKLTEKQDKLVTEITQKKIVIVTGPAGTSKTFCLSYAAIQLLKTKQINKIILCKPTVIVSGSIDLGALPGSLEEKTDVFAESFLSNFSQLISTQDLKMLKETKVIEFKPVQYMRGGTFDNAIVLIDEIQNFHINELITLITRLGKNTKLVFAGDVRQNDIKTKFIAVKTLIKLVEGLTNVSLFEFEKKDIMRDPILIEIIDRFEKMQDEGDLPESKND